MRHIFSAARAPSSSSFDYYMDQVKLLKPASHASMMKNPPYLWVNYACRDNVIWDQVTTNMSESANNMIGDEVNACYNLCVFRLHISWKNEGKIISKCGSVGGYCVFEI